MRIVASADVAAFVRANGGQLFVWTEFMRYGAGNIFVLEASTESPGADRGFQRFPAAEGFDVLFDPGEHEMPEHILLAVKGWPRRRVRAYWNGNSFARD